MFRARIDYNITYLFVFIAFFLESRLFGQPTSPPASAPASPPTSPPGAVAGSPCFDGECVPIDSGIIFLIVVGLFLAIKKLSKGEYGFR